MELALKSAAKRDNVSVSSKATELIRLALEIEEDVALTSIAKERDTRGVVPLSHDKVWGKILKK